MWAVAQPLRIGALRHSPIGFGWLAKKGIPKEITKSWLRSLLADRGVRRDTAKLLKGARPRHTQEAARHFGEFDKPCWSPGPGEGLLPVEYGERLARDFPQGLERIEDSWTFVPEDQPERLSALISSFAREPAGCRVVEPTAGRLRPAAILSRWPSAIASVRGSDPSRRLRPETKRGARPNRRAP